MYISKIHSDSLVIDGHCDSVLHYDGENFFDFNIDNQCVHLDHEKMKAGCIDLQFIALFIEDKFLPQAGFSNCVRLLETFRENILDNPEFNLITSKRHLDMLSQQANNKKYGLLTVEGGEVLEGNIALLRALFNLGVRGLTLTWNRRNQLADGCGLEERASGLTEFGSQVIYEMEKLGMLIDVSHLSLTSFYEVIQLVNTPVVATHSNAFSLTKHPRNLTDDQLKSIADTDGVIGLNFAPHFLKTTAQSPGLEDMYRHIRHMLNVVGEDHIALGSDFDGVDLLPEGIESAADLPKLTEYLHKKGISDQTLEKILGLNWLRVLQKVMPDC